MSELRVGVIGAGEIFQTRHAAFLNSPQTGMRVSWLCDVDPLVRASSARALGASCTPLRSLRDADLAMVDAIVIAASGDHAPLIEDILTRSDLPVFTEKPLTMSVASGRRLAERVGARVERIFVGYNRLCAPAFADFRKIVADDESGSRSLTLRCVLPDDILYRDQFHVFRRSPEPSMEERLESSRWFEEVILNLAIHELSLLRALDPSATLTSALRLPTGCLTTFESALVGTVVLHLECLRGSGGGYYEAIEFNSDQQRVRLEYPSVYLRDHGARLERMQFSRKGLQRTVQTDRVDPVEAQWRTFVQFVRGAEAGEHGFDHALNDIVRAEQIHRLAVSPTTEP